MVSQDRDPFAQLVISPETCLADVRLDIVKMIANVHGCKYVAHYFEDGVSEYTLEFLLLRSYFYISGPICASPGEWSPIRVNKMKLPRYFPEHCFTPFRWRALRHEDSIVVCYFHVGRVRSVEFKFRCLWGKSKKVRRCGEDMSSLTREEKQRRKRSTWRKRRRRHCRGEQVQGRREAPQDLIEWLGLDKDSP
jgi:hypothetical protein